MFVVPLALAMWQQPRPAEDTMVDDEPATLAAYNYGRVRLHFGVCVDDYRDGCFWFEPADMLRTNAIWFVVARLQLTLVFDCAS